MVLYDGVMWGMIVVKGVRRMDKRIALNIDSELLRAVKEQALKEERTVSQEIRHILREYLKKKGVLEE